MKKITKILLVLSIIISVKAQDTTSGKIAILPFVSNGIDPVSVQTAELLLRMDLGKVSSMDIISEKKHNLQSVIMNAQTMNVQKTSVKSLMQMKCFFAN